MYQAKLPLDDTVYLIPRPADKWAFRQTGKIAWLEWRLMLFGCLLNDNGSGIAIKVVPLCHRKSEHVRYFFLKENVVQFRCSGQNIENYAQLMRSQVRTIL